MVDTSYFQTIVDERLKEINDWSNIYQARFCKVEHFLLKHQREIENMVTAYKEIAGKIQGIELFLDMLYEEEKKEFAYVDLTQLKKQQIERLKSIQIFLDVEIDRLKGIPLIRHKELSE